MFKQWFPDAKRMHHRYPTLLQYGVAVATVLLAFVLGQLFTPVFGNNPDAFFLAAVVFSVWASGLRAGLLATLLSGLILGYSFLAPTNRFQLTTLALIHLGIFFLIGFFINAMFTLRRPAESVQTQTSQQLGVILENVADGITVQDRTGRIVYANYAAARMSGFPSVDAMLKASPEEIEARYEIFDEFGVPFPPNSLPGRLALTGMRVPEATVRFRNTVTGEERWSHIKARPILNEHGEITLAINLIQDITVFKTSERRLQAERNRFEVTLSSIGDGVIATDVEGKVTFLNPTAEALTGWQKGLAYGKSIDAVFRIINEETREPAESPVARVLREGAVVGLANHTILISRNGNEYPIDDSGAPIRDLDGNLIGVVLIFRDITERRQAERERAELLRREQAARAEAEEANRLKVQFLGMISHELRTPLASIKGFATTLLAPDVEWDRKSQEEYIEIINQESDRLAELVEQLLDISRVQAGQLQVNPKPHALTAIISSARARLDTIVADHQFVTSVPDDLPPVLADEQRIAQVLVNLVDNAAKYSPKQTRITLSAAQKDDSVQVDVTDEGGGIPPEDRELVFEAFRQIHRRPTQKGAGLGLAISKGLVEAHGGRIWIHEGTASGTTVSFTLPIAKDVL